MGAKDGRVAREIVEAVHDDSDDNVEHNEAAEEDERDEVKVSDVGAASLVGVDLKAGGLVDLMGAFITGSARDAGHHDIRPSFPGGASEQHHESLEDGPEVVVAFNGSVGVQVDVAEELHPDDGVDEEQHDHQHHDVRQGLDGLNEGKEQDPDAHAPSEEFDQTSRSEQP